MHATQLPLPSQTSFVPQVVPTPVKPVCPHTDCPDEHEVVPARQRLPEGLQGVFAVHAMQFPRSQTSFVPQTVPSLTFVVFVQVDEPVEHDVVPVWHGLPPGLQAWLGVHEPH